MLHVLAIGGEHQLPHFLPVAFELDRRKEVKVRFFTLDQKGADAVNRLASRLGYPRPSTSILKLPAPIQWLIERTPLRKAEKVLRLVYWSQKLRNADALLSAERTSTILKRLPGRCPFFMHIPHGAGDRAIGFERRIKLFDEVLTLGRKDRQRMIDEGLVAQEHCHVVGPLKLASFTSAQKKTSLFGNGRPIILYNPHFHPVLGTFEDMAERFLQWATSQNDYNLVIAPHVRLAENWSSEKVANWTKRSISDKVIVDMGSSRSSDMTYTNASSIYCGDVSSQIYEFIARPRPCFFVDSNSIDWQSDPNFAMWHFGPTFDVDADIGAAIAEAVSTHSDYVERQRDAAISALEGIDCADDGVIAASRIIDRAAVLVAGLITDSRRQ